MPVGGLLIKSKSEQAIDSNSPEKGEQRENPRRLRTQSSRSSRETNPHAVQCSAMQCNAVQSRVETNTYASLHSVVRATLHCNLSLWEEGRVEEERGKQHKERERGRRQRTIGTKAVDECKNDEKCYCCRGGR